MNTAGRAAARASSPRPQRGDASKRPPRSTTSAPIIIAQECYPHLKDPTASCSSSPRAPTRAAAAATACTPPRRRAVVNLTQALADEWAEAGVRVNCINPERTGTPMRTQGVRRGAGGHAARRGDGGDGVDRHSAVRRHRPDHRRAPPRRGAATRLTGAPRARPAGSAAGRAVSAHPGGRARPPGPIPPGGAVGPARAGAAAASASTGGFGRIRASSDARPARNGPPRGIRGDAGVIGRPWCPKRPGPSAPLGHPTRLARRGIHLGGRFRPIRAGTRARIGRFRPGADRLTRAGAGAAASAWTGGFGYIRASSDARLVPETARARARGRAGGGLSRWPGGRRRGGAAARRPPR